MLCAACSMRHLKRSVECFSVLLRHECVLWHDTLHCRSATSGGPFGCTSLLIWRHVSSIAVSQCMMFCCIHVLAGMLDVRVARPGCRGQAYACLRLTHSIVMVCIADQCAQNVHTSTPVQRWIVKANWQSSANASINSQHNYHLMNSLHQHYHHQTCCRSPPARTINMQYSYSAARRIRG